MDQFTNYELLDLIATYSSDAGSHFMNFVAIFSAYIVAGYVLADKIGHVSLVLFTALYSAVVMMPAVASFLVLMTAVDLGTELGSRPEMFGANTPMLVAVMTGASGEYLKYSNPILQICAYLGSVAFVFQTRRRKHAKAA